VAIHVGQADGAANRLARSQKTTQDDAAVAPQDHDETTLRSGPGYAPSQIYGIRCDLAFIPRPAGRTNIVAIGCWYNISTVGSAQALDDIEASQNSWRAIKVTSLTVIVRSNTDARWRSYKRY